MTLAMTSEHSLQVPKLDANDPKLVHYKSSLSSVLAGGPHDVNYFPTGRPSGMNIPPDITLSLPNHTLQNLVHCEWTSRSEPSLIRCDRMCMDNLVFTDYKLYCSSWWNQTRPQNCLLESSQLLRLRACHRLQAKVRGTLVSIPTWSMCRRVLVARMLNIKVRNSRDGGGSICTQGVRGCTNLWGAPCSNRSSWTLKRLIEKNTSLNLLNFRNDKRKFIRCDGMYVHGRPHAYR